MKMWQHENVSMMMLTKFIFLGFILDNIIAFSSISTSISDSNNLATSLKSELLSTIALSPANIPTSIAQTKSILSLVRELEDFCPTKEEDVLQELGGNWQLLWTAQDPDAPIGDGLLGSLTKPFRSFINPLENQAYSNNPSAGRSNPFLPREIQDRVEALGIMSSDEISDDEGLSSSPAISTQAVDLKNKRVRNVVSFRLGDSPLLKPLIKSGNGSSLRGSITVDVNFKSNPSDLRRVDVKFDRCRLSVKNILSKPLSFPLGPIGPTGWLKTVYIDDSMRITRGHKGSVFVLLRTSKRINDREGLGDSN